MKIEDYGILSYTTYHQGVFMDEQELRQQIQGLRQDLNSKLNQLINTARQLRLKRKELVLLIRPPYLYVIEEEGEGR